jgi:hypothetical protein
VARETQQFACTARIAVHLRIVLVGTLGPWPGGRIPAGIGRGGPPDPTSSEGPISGPRGMIPCPGHVPDHEAKSLGISTIAASDTRIES